MEGYSIKCTGHTYITLEWNDQFIKCYDNDMTYMEDIIEAIEKRTRMKFTDIPRKSDIQSFDGLRFLHGGFKKGADWLIQEEIQEVKKAMSSLGYPIRRNPELDFIGKDRCKVIYDGHLIIGIYDFIKHTFVD